MNTLRTLLILLVFLSGFYTPSDAQNWKRTYGTNSGFESATAAVEVPNNGYTILCHAGASGFDASYAISELSFLMELDAWGGVVSRDTLEGLWPYRMKPYENDGFVLYGMKTDEEFYRPFLSLYDANGDNLWTEYYQDTLDYGSVFFECIRPQDVTVLEDGSIMFHAAYYIEGTSISEEYLFKVSAAGELLWRKPLTLYPFYGQFDFETASDGNIIISKDYSSEEITKIDTAGNQIWSNTYGTYGQVKDIVPTSDGGVIFFESGFGANVKIDGDGNFLEEYSWTADLIFPYKGIALNDGTYASAGHAWENGDPSVDDTDFYMARAFGPMSGEWEFIQYFDPLDQIAYDIIQTSDDGFLLSGFSESANGGRNIRLIKVDSEGEFVNANVVGSVINDENLNCDLDVSESSLGGFVIIAEGADTTYTTSDDEGNYTLGLNLGVYTIRIVSPNDYWSFCEESVSVNLVNLYEDTTVDFLGQAETVCPYLEVDITTPFLRRCFDNTYYVSYCNTGTEDATDVSVEVTLDDFMEVAWTSIPYTSNTGNLYVFDIGDVGLGECNDFQIYFELDPDCDSTVLGETHCVEAHVYPDSFCMVDPSWTGANVALSSDCAPDSLSFFIENNGTGNMAGPLAYIIIEDEVILLQGVFELDIDEIKTLKVPSNGSTYRLEAEQEPNHPTNDEVSLTVEGCGENANGDVSYGFVNLYPDNDGNPFVEIDCQENIGAFDPNDKQGFPIGYDEEHYIDQNEEIEYMIRFQNTGTDTAFNVVVLDSLSRYLNPVSVRPGASSHPYDFSIRDNGVLVFTFENIMLPDSNINEPASHGFFKFRIDQLLDVPLGSEILNSGAIYFDFNDPVITNTTLHTVGENYMIVNSQEIFVPNLEVLVYPNPFKEQVTFEVKELLFFNLSLDVYDGLGLLVRREQFEGNKLNFYKKNLSPGVYFYSIKNEGQIISTGKLVVQ